MADKNVIENIEARVGALVEDHKRLGGVCRELTSERDALKAANRMLEERVRELEEELARRQLAAGLSGTKGDKDKARARVNRLMREVDKCLALVAGMNADPEGQEAQQR